MDDTPRPTQLATLAYLHRDGETLMLHRNKRPDDYHFGRWNGLGGKLLAGESPDCGMRREVLEESGLVVGACDWKGVITFPLFDGKRDWYVFVYVTDDFSGTLVDPPEGTLSWVSTAALSSLSLWPGDRLFLPWLSVAGYFSARICYENGEVREHSVEWYHRTQVTDPSG